MRATPISISTEPPRVECAVLRAMTCSYQWYSTETLSIKVSAAGEAKNTKLTHERLEQLRQRGLVLKLTKKRKSNQESGGVLWRKTA